MKAAARSVSHLWSKVNLLLLANDLCEPRIKEVASALSTGTLTLKSVKRMEELSGSRLDPVHLKISGIAYLYLWDFARSEERLTELFRCARHDSDRCSAQASLAAGFFRQRKYQQAYEFAASALAFDRGMVAAWLIAAAAVGRLGDGAASEQFIQIFSEVFSDLGRFPAVVQILVEDPDLEHFTCLKAFPGWLRDALLKSYEQIRLTQQDMTSPTSAVQRADSSGIEGLRDRVGTTFQP